MVLAHRETRVLKGLQAAFGREQPQGTRLIGGIEQQLAAVQRQLANMPIESHVHRAVGVQPQLRAVRQAQIADLADSGALIGRPLPP